MIKPVASPVQISEFMNFLILKNSKRHILCNGHVLFIFFSYNVNWPYSLFSLPVLKCHVALHLYLLPSLRPFLLLPVSYCTALLHYHKWEKMTPISVPLDLISHSLHSNSNNGVYGKYIRVNRSSSAVSLVKDHRVSHCFTEAMWNWMLPCLFSS